MAGNDERASPREFVTAVVAIVVGGLVSLAGVVVGCQSSRDAQDTAREAQLETARAERERADLSELRSVLDRAASDLQRLADEAGTGALGERGRAKQLAALSTALDATGKSRVRLAIRLGDQANATKFFTRAIDSYYLAGRPGTETTEAFRHLGQGDQAAERYHAEARRLGRLPATGRVVDDGRGETDIAPADAAGARRLNAPLAGCLSPRSPRARLPRRSRERRLQCRSPASQ